VNARHGSSIVNGIDLASHLGLIRMALRRFRWALGAVIEDGDLFQAGWFGLRRAAERFDPGLGYKFSTYALPWIRHHVARTIADERRTVRLPVWFQDQARLDGERLPLDALSLDAPARASDPDSTWLDMLAGSDDPSAEAEAAQRRELVAAALAELPERLRGVLVSRFWGEEQTLQQIGDGLGLTRERVRQLEADALERLRGRLAKRSFDVTSASASKAGHHE
jgi:RNA polymerase sigma factor (sigma-70 family)